MDKVSELETAILERASHLAEEYRQRAQRGRENILDDAHERLHLREEREVLLAKAKAERTYRRMVQANELRLDAQMDRLRWELVQCVRERMADRFKALMDDRERYLKLLGEFLAQGAAAIPGSALVVELNRRDHEAVEATWADFIAEAVPDREVELGPECPECLGGLLVRTPDNRMRVDNTFDGRMRRLDHRILQTIVERLLPQTPESSFRTGP
ncbi:MAG: V-type ATP synthase subunit E family protein [Chromatiales bacterium]